MAPTQDTIPHKDPWLWHNPTPDVISGHEEWRPYALGKQRVEESAQGLDLLLTPVFVHGTDLTYSEADLHPEEVMALI